MDTYEETIYSSLIIACVAIGALLCFMLLSIILRQNKILDQQANYILKEVQAVEDERKRIANNLHDDLGPILSSLKRLVNRFCLSRPDDLENLKLTNKYLDYVMENVKSLSAGLTPASLPVTGLIPAIKDFIDLMNLDPIMQVYFVHDAAIVAGQEKEIHIYRLVQETLWNAKKHSGATTLLLRIRKRDPLLIVEVQDDGKGFDFNKELQNSRGMGLASISHRLKILRGTISVVPSENNRQTLIFEIPLNS